MKIRYDYPHIFSTLSFIGFYFLLLSWAQLVYGLNTSKVVCHQFRSNSFCRLEAPVWMKVCERIWASPQDLVCLLNYANYFHLMILRPNINSTCLLTSSQRRIRSVAFNYLTLSKQCQFTLVNWMNDKLRVQWRKNAINPFLSDISGQIIPTIVLSY